VSNLQGTDEQLISRVVAAVLRELGHVDAAPEAPDPEYLSDPDVRRVLVRVSRSKYYELMRLPDFPAATRIGKTNFRKVSAVRAWLAARQAV
jgi:predicted DNA-binding transcriptional regulator AlpA